MITGGNVTVFVSNMDRAVGFYTETLGLKLAERYGDHWASVRVGDTLSIGLHPKSAKFAAPGTQGAMHIGLQISEPIDAAVERLRTKGVQFQERSQGDGGSFVYFSDPDGNLLYLWAARS